MATLPNRTTTKQAISVPQRSASGPGGRTCARERSSTTVAKKRGNNEGSITRRKDGLWMAQVTIGRDPATGTLKRATFYGKTRQDVADKLTKALVEKNQGTLVGQHRLTWASGLPPGSLTQEAQEPTAHLRWL